MSSLVISPSPSIRTAFPSRHCAGIRKGLTCPAHSWSDKRMCKPHCMVIEAPMPGDSDLSHSGPPAPLVTLISMQNPLCPEAADADEV